MSILSGLRSRREAAQYGSAGTSASLAHRTVLVRWRRLTLKGKARVTVAGAAIGAVAGYAGTQTLTGALWGAAGVVGAGALTVALLAVPGALLSLLIVLATVAFLPMFGSLYTASAGAADMAGGAVALLIAYVVAIIITLRWGRGRAWVSVLAVSVSLLIPGVALVLLVPGLGLNAARLSLLAVALARSNGGPWIAGSISAIWDRIRHGRDNDSVVAVSAADPQDVSAAWERQAIAERESARVLRDLGPDYTVFHDVAVPRTRQHVPHIIVGPTGVKLVASAHALGPVRVEERTGLVIPGVDVAALTWNLMEQRAPVAKALRVLPRDIEMIIVVHGSYALDRMTVAAIDVDDSGQRASSRLVVTSPECLGAVVTDAFTSWSTLKTRQTVRRARMRLTSVPVPQTVAVWPPASLELAVVNEDGHPVTSVGEQASGMPTWSSGDRVSVQTNLGVLHNLRVVGGMTGDPAGLMIVRVCTEDEWQTRSFDPSHPESTLQCYVFPVNCLLRPAR
jgi:hypothetical protein